MGSWIKNNKKCNIYSGRAVLILMIIFDMLFQIKIRGKFKTT